MDEKSSIRFWFFWGSVFVTGFILLITGSFSTEGGLRIVLICATAIWLVLCILLVIGKTGKLATSQAEKRSELNAKATIISKEIITSVDCVPDGSGGYFNTETKRYNVTFRTQDHKLWTFDVSSELFCVLAEGDCGVVVYKESNLCGRRFVRFQRHG